MKKKFLVALGATVCGLALVSCTTNTNNDNNNGGGGNGGGGDNGQTQKKTGYNFVEAPTDENYTALENSQLNVYVNYNGKNGITYRGSTAYANPVDNATYRENSLLPTWQTFAAKTKLTINDVADYTASDDTAVNTNFTQKYEGKDGAKVDLIYLNTKYIDSAHYVNLLEHLDKMPNFARFLENNPTIKKNILKGEGIYYTPYFDGYNDIEKMFIMDTALAAKVLDATDAELENFDTLVCGGSNPAANVVKGGYVTPYINAEHNYAAATTTVDIQPTATSAKSTLTIKQTSYNILAKQNEMLAAGTTGKELAKTMRAYLKQAIGDEVGEGKTYANYSDFFTSSAAAYNVDELIALMRLVKANPGVVTGDSNQEVVTFFPRGHEDNRVDNILDFIQVWGIQGLTAEKDNIYFGADGKLHDLNTTQASYDALTQLSALYDEGLILTEFWNKPSTIDKTAYLDTYFKKNKNNGGYGFLMYDYSAATGAANDMVDGIGTKADKRVGTFKNLSVTGVRPVITPLSYWSTESYSNTQRLSDLTGKTLVRHTEDTRALKNNSWAIPTNYQNLDGALRMMDYLFSARGLMNQDFGPEAYWAKPTVGDSVNGTIVTNENVNTLVDANKVYVSDDIVNGELTPIMSKTLKAMVAWGSNNGQDFWSFMRGYIGSTHGVGHVRSKGIDIQATNEYAAFGLKGLKAAIANDVVQISLVDKVKGQYNWLTCVPSANYDAPTTAEAKDYAAITEFWSAKHLNAKATGWVYVVKEAYNGLDKDSKQCGTAESKEYSYNDVLAQISKRDTVYLWKMAKSISNDVIPAYALQAQA